MRYLFYLLLLTILNFTSIEAKYQWYPFVSLKIPRMIPEVQPINSNNFIVFGGFDNNGAALNSSEIVNTLTGEITPGPIMNSSHAFSSSCMNTDSLIVVCGGNIRLSDGCTAIVEKYDKINNSWILIGNMKYPRSQHSSIFINDSLLLIVGGEANGNGTYDHGEIFNIKSGITTEVFSLPFGMNLPKLEKLSNGDIIMFGGRSGRENSTRTSNVYKFNKENFKWTTLSNLKYSLANLASIKTLSGKVLAVCGVQSENPLKMQKEVYLESDSGNIKDYSYLKYERNWCSLGNFNDSIVVVSGGFNNATALIQESEIIDIKNKIILLGPQNYSSRRYHTSITMTTGNRTRLFIVGGIKDNFETLSSIEEFISEYSSSPTIQDFVKNCNGCMITVKDETSIALVKLIQNSTNNVMINTVKTIDKKYTTITLSLIDASKKGYFELKIFNNLGFVETIIDTIFSDAYSNNQFSDFNKVGDAILVNDTIQLTSSSINQSGAVWFNKPFNIKRSFTLNFSFKYLSKESFCEESISNSGDGFAFVIQNKGILQIGENNGGLGYSSLENAIAFEFDKYKNSTNSQKDCNDPNNNHFAIHHSKSFLSSIHNAQSTLYINSDIPQLYNNAVYNVNLNYDSKFKKLIIYLDSANKYSKLICKLDNFSFDKYINFESDIFFIGFTSSTGCSIADFKLFNFNTCYENNVLSDVKDSDFSYKISPNPATDYIEINLGAYTNLDLAASIEIFNIFGEKESTSVNSVDTSTNSGQIKIDISNLMPGVYFIRVGEKFEKFVKI